MISTRGLSWNNLYKSKASYRSKQEIAVSSTSDEFWVSQLSYQMQCGGISCKNNAGSLGKKQANGWEHIAGWNRPRSELAQMNQKGTVGGGKQQYGKAKRTYTTLQQRQHRARSPGSPCPICHSCNIRSNFGRTLMSYKNYDSWSQRIAALRKRGFVQAPAVAQQKRS